MERTWVVRTRHAHSWALAWVDGAWRDVDSTPPGWAEAEAFSASMWQPVKDLWAWGMYVFEQWRYGERRGGMTTWLAWLLIPLGLILIWRLFFVRRQRRAGAPKRGGGAARILAGADSEFYAVERRLGALGLARAPAEAAGHWLERIGEQAPVAGSSPELERLLALHYRYRFDPEGLATADRERLRADAEHWLAAHAEMPR
jgi:hypothetical protein